MGRVPSVDRTAWVSHAVITGKGVYKEQCEDNAGEVERDGDSSA